MVQKQVGGAGIKPGAATGEKAGANGPRVLVHRWPPRQWRSAWSFTTPTRST